jgi:hypothetical protein
MPLQYPPLAEQISNWEGHMSNNMTNSRRLALTIGVSALAFAAAGAAQAADFIKGDSLVISTTTYEDVGAVAGLVAGVTAIPGGTAVSNGALNRR